MQVTRDRILTYLGKHPPSSAGEISRYLEMTPANIRYHLDILVEEGLVCGSGERPAGGVGRPILLFSLTSNSLGDNLSPLLEVLLSELTDSENQEQTINQITEILIKGKLERKRSRVQRFNEGIEFLNSMHYHASWEARPQGPQVALRHCPYQDLAQNYPILCQLDEKLLQEIFGTKMNLIQKRDLGKDPLSPCLFLSA